MCRLPTYYVGRIVPTGDIGRRVCNVNDSRKRERRKRYALELRRKTSDFTASYT